MRITLASDLAPRKIGSMEETFVAFARAARARGHDVHLLGRPPVHPWFARELQACGATWTEIAKVEQSFVGGVQWLRAHADVLLYTLLPLRGRLALQAAAAWPTQLIYLDETSTPSGWTRPGALRRAGYQLIHRRMHTYLCCSEYVRQRGMALYGLDLSDARVIYNGVNLDRFTPRASRPAGPPRVMTVINLIAEKGADTLIEAFAQVPVPDARLAIAGRGIQLPMLEEQARALGIADRVDFLGLRDDVQALLHETDVFVHPARWQEAFGYSVAEAMASGLPVVSTDRGALGELIEDGVSGLLVPGEDPPRMAAAITRLLTNPDEAARLGAAARAKAVAQFDYRRAVDAMIEVVEAAGARGARSRPARATSSARPAKARPGSSAPRPSPCS
ncbi:MAG: glycosyltransferase family 4 protein [Gemmatimonadetes bacterium]|nr:glycosyltransferase family 4 protein [Gemmatimonadota bacterium]